MILATLYLSSRFVLYLVANVRFRINRLGRGLAYVNKPAFDARAIMKWTKNMEIIQYDEARYSKLLLAKNANSELDKTIRNKIEQMGEIICRHGLQHIVGIALLHRHFTIEPSQRMVRRIYSKFATIKPENVSPSFVPYIWGFSPTSDRVIYPIEFTDSNQHPIAHEQAKTIQKADDFLRELSDLLVELEATHLVGIASLHLSELMPIEAGEIRLEQGNIGEESLRISVVRNVDERSENPMVTVWEFEADSSLASVKCRQSSHCCCCLT